MRFPLVVYGLLLIGLLAVYAYFQSRKPKRPQSAWGSGEKAATGQALAEMVTDSTRFLILLAGGALLDIAFGKPSLILQYAAWAVVVLQVLKCGTIYSERKLVTFVLRLAGLACLGYIWMMQLPFFDVLPP